MVQNRQTDRQTNKHTNRHTYIHKDRQTDRLITVLHPPAGEQSNISKKTNQSSNHLKKQSGPNTRVASGSYFTGFVYSLSVTNAIVIVNFADA